MPSSFSNGVRYSSASSAPPRSRSAPRRANVLRLHAARRRPSALAGAPTCAPTPAGSSSGGPTPRPSDQVAVVLHACMAQMQAAAASTCRGILICSEHVPEQNRVRPPTAGLVRRSHDAEKARNSGLTSCAASQLPSTTSRLTSAPVALDGRRQVSRTQFSSRHRTGESEEIPAPTLIEPPPRWKRVAQRRELQVPGDRLPLATSGMPRKVKDPKPSGMQPSPAVNRARELGSVGTVWPHSKRSHAGACRPRFTRRRAA